MARTAARNGNSVIARRAISASAVRAGPVHHADPPAGLGQRGGGRGADHTRADHHDVGLGREPARRGPLGRT